MRVVFLTVADPHIGLGHLYRCDALATGLKERGVDTTVAVDCRLGADWLEARAPETPWSIVQWTDNPDAVTRATADADQLIIDAYDITPEVRDWIERHAPAPIYFDDYGTNIPRHGTVINGSPGAHLVGYPERPGLVLLLGPHYQVLRKPFWQPPDRTIGERIESVAVVLGGTDHRGLMNSVLSVVRDSVPPDATLYAIGVEPNLINRADTHATGYLSASDLKDLFDRLDLLVSAAGQTIAEAVACRLPTVMIQTAENQRYNVLGWIEERAAIMGSIESGTTAPVQLTEAIEELRKPAKRNELVDRMKNLMITHGTANVAEYVTQGLP